MSKYVIEIDDKKLYEYDKDTATYFPRLWKAKGFNSLVFDENGLDKLTPLDKELEKAYQKGYETGQYETTTLEYQRGLNDAWEVARKIAQEWEENAEAEQRIVIDDSIKTTLDSMTASEAITKLREYEQQKADEIKVSDVITDGKCNYLVIDITDKSYIALQGTDFEPVYIGKDYIKYYHNLHDSKDMTKVAEEINRAVKGEQRN